MDKISIVVPCYNMEQYIIKCINSIKQQTYKNIEVLMIDDGSKDNTKSIIMNEIKDDDRFKYYYKSNGGLSDARNYGLKYVSGNYVCFIDSDDYISNDYVEKLYKAITENDSDISIGYFTRVYGKKEKLNTIGKNIDDLIKHPAAWNKMYKTSLFIDNGIEYPVGYWYEDLDVFLKFIFITNKFSFVESSIYYYIQNSSSIMHTVDDRIYGIYHIIEDIEDFAKDRNKYNENKKLLEYINVYHILIGTVYRASFAKTFSKKTISDIAEYVSNKYPNWYSNEYIKKCSLIYRIYLKCLYKKRYGLIKFILKIFNKHMSL